MPRYKLTIEYDGTGICGWQIQNDAPTVQGLLQDAVETFSGERCKIVGSGRTDSGVHALGQVAHVDLTESYPEFTVMQAINFHLLPARVVVTRAEIVADSFHARFSAKQRRYLYRICNRRARLALEENRMWHIPQPLDQEAMHQAAQQLMGTHDFSTFRDSLCQSASPVKTLDRIEVKRMDEDVLIRVAAKSFLHHQVRNMAGSLAYVGLGKWSQQDFTDAFAARDRTRGGPTAPAEGLYFMGVEY